MADDPLFKFLQSVTEKIKVEKEHKALMEKIDDEVVVEPKEDPLLSAINVLKQKIVEVKQPAVAEAITDKAEEAPVTVKDEPQAIEEKDNFGDFLSKLKDIISGDKSKTVFPAAPTETVTPVVQEQENTEPEPQKNKIDAEDIKSDYVDILDKLSNEVAVEKEPQKISEIKKLIEQYAEKYFKKAAVMSEYAGGGGTNAVQYANGGVMNGDLNVNGNYLSGGVNLLEIFSGGGGGSGDPDVNALVHATSGNWNSTYTTVQGYSGTWSTGIQDLSFDESNAQLSISNGNTVSLSALSGGTTDRLVKGSYQVVLSSNGVTNIPGVLTVPGLTGGAITSATPLVSLASFLGQSNVPVNQIGTGGAINVSMAGTITVANPGKNYVTGTAIIGIGTPIAIIATPQGWVFNPNGSITFPNNATQTTAFTGNPDSSKWDSNYTTTNTNSANWSQAYTNLTSNSAAYLSGVDISLLAAASGSWNSNYTTTNTNSANWQTSYSNAIYTVNGTANQIVATPAGSNTGSNSVTLSFAPSAYFPGTVSIGGNLYVSGTAAYINVADLVVDDALIYLANSNPANLLDIGLVAHFTQAPLGYQHTGLVRRAGEGRPGTWTLFSGLTTEPLTGNNIDWADKNITLDSLSANIYSSTGNSYQWSSNWTTTNTNSANWSQAYTNLTTNSATYLSGVDISLLVSTSASWNSTYTTVSANSASWLNQGTLQTYLSTSNVLLSAATITQNLSVGGTIFSSATANVLGSYNVTIGDGINSSFNVTHNFNTTNINVAVFDAVTNTQSYPKVVIVNSNTVSVQFSYVPSSNAFNVIVFAPVPSNRVAAYAGYSGAVTRQFDLVTVGTNSYSYCGTAPNASATNQSVWTIKRLYFSTAGALLSSGTVYNSVWDNRYSYNY